MVGGLLGHWKVTGRSPAQAALRALGVVVPEVLGDKRKNAKHREFVVWHCTGRRLACAGGGERHARRPV